MHRIKLLIFSLSKWAGLFFIARQLTHKGLRVLCYHGFALADEDHFRPKLFMQKDTFAQRMNYLAKQNYPVLELEEALEPNAIVISELNYRTPYKYMNLGPDPEKRR